MPALATDPPKSEAQRLLMWSIATGKGASGGPGKEVAREFTESDPGGKLPVRAKDMARSQFGMLKKLLDKFFSEEEKEPEHAEDTQHPKIGDRIEFADDKFTDKGPAETSIIRATDGNVGVQWDKDEFEDFTWAKLAGVARPIERDGKTIWMIGKQPGAEDDGELATAPNGAIPTAASVLYGTPTGHVLFVKRSKTEENWPDTWSLPGGKADDGEEPTACAVRESKEEIGYDADVAAMHEVERKQTEHGWQHVLFSHAVDKEFTPKLNDEHSEHIWAPIDGPYPEPLHPGVKASLDKLRVAAAKDGSEEEIAKDAVEHDPKNGQFTASTAPGGAGSKERIAHHKNASEFHSKSAKGLQGAGKKYTEHLNAHDLHKSAAHEHAGVSVGVTGPKFADEVSERARKASAALIKGSAKDTAHDALLGPYTVRTQRDGVWAYDAALLTTAARRARLAGRGDLARRAEAIRVREFGGANDTFAFDRDSVRREDEDGRLHVDEANISIADVNEYTGREINQVMADKPGWKSLDPDRRYKLLRDPDEIAKAVDSFNNLPVLDEHLPITADNHDHKHVIGSTGTDAKFDGEHLKNSLVFWPRSAIDKIESGETRELSSAYRYLAEMKPGIYKGKSYDGRMTNLSGSHVALVRKGRAGPTVSVGDAAPDDAWQLLERAIRHAGVR